MNIPKASDLPMRVVWTPPKEAIGKSESVKHDFMSRYAKDPLEVDLVGVFTSETPGLACETIASHGHGPIAIIRFLDKPKGTRDYNGWDGARCADIRCPRDKFTSIKFGWGAVSIKDLEPHWSVGPKKIKKVSRIIKHIPFQEVYL